jgi:hypothetical protein
MSVLVFVDESRIERPEVDRFVRTVAGVAFEENAYGDLSGKLLRLKGRFFKRYGIGDFPLRGRLLLNARAFESYRKIEFVREVFSLCRLQNAITFATTQLASAQDPNEGGQVQPSREQSVFSESDSTDGKGLPLRLVYLMERVNSFMLENHPGQVAKLVFKIEGSGGGYTVSSSIMELMYRSPLGRGFQGILGAPLFAPHAHAPGLQIADVFTYIINQHHAGQMRLREFYSEVESMQYVSAFEKDEYELRGINTIGGDF